jgi:hypothetical protein
MTADLDQSASDTRTTVNRMAVVSILCAAVALVATYFAGVAAIAVFAAGAGHVALRQIDVRQERGALLARVALVVAYLIATVALAQTLYVALQGA